MCEVTAFDVSDKALVRAKGGKQRGFSVPLPAVGFAFVCFVSQRGRQYARSFRTGLPRAAFLIARNRFASFRVRASHGFS